MNTIRVPLADTQSNRSYLNTKDYMLQNCFIERTGDRNCIVKRPGWTKEKVITTSPTDARGFTYCDAHGLYYAAIGDALYSVSSDLATATDIIRKTPTSVSCAAGTASYVFAAAHGFTAGQKVYASGELTYTGYNGELTIASVTTTSVANDTFTVTMTCPGGAATAANMRVSPILTTTGRIYFEQTKDSTAQVVMLHIPKTSTTASQLFKIASGGVVTKVTDSDYPTECVGAGVSIDGYYFVLKENTTSAIHEIYNGDLEAPSSWTSINFISPEKFADAGVTLAKHHNQLVCFKQYSTEFFYDAANTTGSPLSNIAQQTLTIGCAAAESVVQVGNDIIWLSRNQNGGLGIHRLSGGSAVKISTAFIDKILASIESIVFAGTLDSTYVSFEGHDFYILSFEGNQTTTQAIAGVAIAGIAIAGFGGSLNTFKRTLVYDMTESTWSEWTSLDSVSNTQSRFFGAYAISGPHVSNVKDYTNTLILEKTSGDIYSMYPTPVTSNTAPTYKDGTRAITVKIVTDNLDGGSRYRKKHGRLEIIGDANTATSTLSVYTSDDDYQTWTSARTVDLSSRAFLNNLGTFRRRSFKLEHSSDTPLRLEALELQVEQMGR